MEKLESNTEHICSYGCGQLAKYKFVNGKYCCENNYNKCPHQNELQIAQKRVCSNETKKKIGLANKNRKVIKILPIIDILCENGCGNIARFKVIKTNKLCCSEHPNQCPINREKVSKGLTGKKIEKLEEIETDKLCDYGCEKVAKFKLKNGKVCCSSSFAKCDTVKNKHKNIKRVPVKFKEIETNELCIYCGKPAKFISATGKYCCSKSWATCQVKGVSEVERYGEEKAKELSEGRIKSQTGRKMSDEFKIERSILTKTRWNDPNDSFNSVEFREDKSKENIERWKDPESPFNSVEFRNNHSICMKELWEDPESVFNSPECRNKKSESMKEAWKKPDSKLRSEASKEKRTKKSLELWKDPEYIKKVQEASHIRPNRPESFLIDLFKDLELSYEYTGDMSFIIDGKNPDFVNKETKKVIDFFGGRFHGFAYRSTYQNDSLSDEEHEEKRITHFANNGYKTLIIWEYELKDIKKVIEKILKFDQE